CLHAFVRLLFPASSSASFCFLSAVMSIPSLCPFLSFFRVPATTHIYTLSLHDALPIFLPHRGRRALERLQHRRLGQPAVPSTERSEEHTSELQSRENLVCRLLLEKKKTSNCTQITS